MVFSSLHSMVVNISIMAHCDAELEGGRRPSHRRMPESRGFNDLLDAGMRRHDGCKVNGTAVIKKQGFWSTDER
jgi:hypothetical protein